MDIADGSAHKCQCGTSGSCLKCPGQNLDALEGIEDRLASDIKRLSHIPDERADQVAGSCLQSLIELKRIRLGIDEPSAKPPINESLL